MKNYVSFWLGNFLSSDDVEKYTKVRYTEDGDSIISQFEKDFRLGYYDRDLIEKDWISEPDNNIKNLLIGFSYDNKLLNEFHSIDKKYNTILLIYNYNYNNGDRVISNARNESYSMDYIGSTVYKSE